MGSKDQRWSAQTSSREHERRSPDPFSRDTGRVDEAPYTPQRDDAAAHAGQREWRQPRHWRDEQAGRDGKVYGRFDSLDGDPHPGAQFQREVTSQEYPVPTQGDGMPGRWLNSDDSEGDRDAAEPSKDD